MVGRGRKKAVSNEKRQDSRYKAILVDFDGVLRQWNASDNIIESKYGLTQGSIQNSAFDKELLDQAIRGIITDRRWRSLIAENLQASQPASDAFSAIEEWSSSAGEINAELLSLLSCCKSQTEILLLTNATSRLNEDLAALGLGNWFTGVINSSETGIVKPEPEIYEAAINACNCAVGNIVYIDDSLENTLAASRVGILSHHYAGVAGCKQFLEEIDLLGNT